MNDIVTEAKEGFCIWTKHGHRPTRFHPTEELANAEAERLARANPGRKFIVMQMRGKFSAPAGDAA